MTYLEKYAYLWHLIAWLLFMLLPFLFSPMVDNLGNQAFQLYFSTKAISYLILIGLFYFNLKVLIPNLLRNKNWVIYGVIMLLFLIVIIRVETILFRVFIQGKTPLANPLSMLPTTGGFPIGRLLGSILSFFGVLGVSSAIALRRDRLKEKEAKQQIQFEKVAIELAVLKLQISPHFLFNTLNNIRWLARQKSERTEDAIVQLSQLLRYIIYQAKNEKVPLEQEINHLKNFIDLQKMRLTQPDCIQFTCEGVIKGRVIEPLLFIPFVENAFKYGVHGQKSSDIVFKIKVKDDSLIFESQNTLFEDNLPKETDDSGIGIQNVQKRLDLHYPNQHELKFGIVEERNPDKNGKDAVFYVYLKIKT